MYSVAQCELVEAPASSPATTWSSCAAGFVDGFFDIILNSSSANINHDLVIVLIPGSRNGSVGIVGFNVLPAPDAVVAIAAPGDGSYSVSGRGTLLSNIGDFGPTDLQVTLAMDNVAYSYQPISGAAIASVLSGTMRVRIDTTKPNDDESDQARAIK